MSYTRQYHEVVSGSKTETVSVSYPASQSGGTTSRTVTVHIEIPVNVNIHVDTNPFDNSVRHCEQNITLLTGAVVATETAAIVSKRKNAKKVGDTIVNGFFSYVKSEISQQVSEITQQTESLLMHLRGLSEACLAKKAQMETDYQRITGRYIKLFADLNRELVTRIHQLDQPAFLFKELSDESLAGAEGSSAVSTVIVFNREQTDVQVKLSSALAKKQAAAAMSKISVFLARQKSADAAISHCMQGNSVARDWLIPVCLTEMSSSPKVKDQGAQIPDGVTAPLQKEIHQFISGQSSVPWTSRDEESLRQLKFYFNKELNQRLPDGEKQTEKVRSMIHHLAKLENIQTIS